jgi:hypothetical protein
VMVPTSEYYFLLSCSCDKIIYATCIKQPIATALVSLSSDMGFNVQSDLCDIHKLITMPAGNSKNVLCHILSFSETEMNRNNLACVSCISLIFMYKLQS